MDLDSKTFGEFITKKKCVVDFWAPWCGPCRMVAPTLEGACGEKGVPLGKVDIDKSPDVAMKFGVMSIPCIILFKDGKEANRKIGNASKESLLQFLG